jgi:putative membrane protein
MQVRLIATAATLTLALAACGQDNAGSADAAASETPMAAEATASAPAASMSGQDFANAAAASDAFEIASSKLAATHSQTAKIKSFAEQMIKAHTESTAKLKAAGAGASPAIVPDPTLKPEQQQLLDTLESKTGADFDTAYADAQVDGHRKALSLLTQYSTQGDVPQLKSFAEGVIPTVTSHLEMANGLKP